MNTHDSDSSDQSVRKEITVPRDPSTEGKAAPRNQPMPSPDQVNAPDEYLAHDADQPLPPESVAGKTLHENPPKTKGQLGVGSAGDAARPTKEGISATTIPPRRDMRE
jgi:hypothetical protein